MHGQDINCSFIWLFKVFCPTPHTFVTFLFPLICIDGSTHTVCAERWTERMGLVESSSFLSNILKPLQSLRTRSRQSFQVLQSQLRIRICRFAFLCLLFLQLPPRTWAAWASVHLSYLQPVTSGRLLSHNHPARFRTAHSQLGGQSRASVLTWWMSSADNFTCVLESVWSLCQSWSLFTHHGAVHLVLNSSLWMERCWMTLSIPNLLCIHFQCSWSDASD